MTSKIQMNQSAEDTTEDVAEDVEKQKKIKEKLKHMGVMPSDENPADVSETHDPHEVHESHESHETRRFSPLLITVLLAFSVAGVMAYVYKSDEIAQLLSFDKSNESSTNETGFANTSQNTLVQDAPDSASNPLIASSNRDYRSAQEQYRAQSQKEREQWLASQRADFDKRREEFMKQSAEAESRFNQSRFNHPGFNQPGYNQPGFNQPNNNQPETNNQNSFNQPQWAASTPPEPPQWVKDRQAEIEKQRAEYLQEIKQQQENFYNNSNNRNYTGSQRPEYFNHPRMNTYQPQPQPQPQATNPAQQIAPQQPAVVYQENQRQYYNPYYYGRQPAYNNAPVYRYGPYNAPYGWQGRGYR